MARVFQIVFTGTLNPSTHTEEAVRDFAAVFKVTEDKARSLIGAGEARVLKTDVDEANAQRYLEVLEEIGLAARIEPLDAPSAGQTPPAAMMSDAAPEAVQAGARATLGPVGRPASHGWGWIQQAWAQFKQQPRAWLAALALVYLMTVALSLVPVIGSLASMILGPVFAGGLMLGARSQQRTGTLRVATAFDGFSQQGAQLATVGVLYVVGLMAVSLVAGLISVATGALTAASMEALSSNDPALIAAVVGPGLGLFLLLVMLCLVPLLMLYWFAPALVVLDGMTAVAAMRLSFRACWKNLAAFAVYGLALLLILAGASLIFVLIAALLGSLSETLMVAAMFLMIPLMLLFAALVALSIFTAYLDVFDRDATGPGVLAF